MILIAAGTYRFTSGTVNDALPPLAAGHVGAVCGASSIANGAASS